MFTGCVCTRYRVGGRKRRRWFRRRCDGRSDFSDITITNGVERLRSTKEREDRGTRCTRAGEIVGMCLSMSMLTTHDCSMAYEFERLIAVCKRVMPDVIEMVS